MLYAVKNPTFLTVMQITNDHGASAQTELQMLDWCRQRLVVNWGVYLSRQSHY